MEKQWALGAVVHSGGVHFRVWAPFADAVHLVGDFNNWQQTETPLKKLDDGTWAINLEHALAGQEYKYLIAHGGQQLERNDPRALQLTSSGDASVIIDTAFAWGDDNFTLSPPHELIIYELHIGTFTRDDPTKEGTFASAIKKLDYLAQIGVNAVEIMPVNAVWEDKWWGYSPTNMYAIETAYGGWHEFLSFVRAAHRHGIGVIADVVYNHFSNTNNNLWQFDGWSQDNKGGIYFYNDWRSHNPWGDTRPDYGRPEVRQYITDNAKLLLEACRVDGLRVDATLAIRKAITTEFTEKVDDIPEGWQLLQELSTAAKSLRPHGMAIAEDLQGNEWLTKPRPDGGAGFGAQWDASFAACIREVLDPADDAARDMEKIRYILNGQYNNNPWQRVIYTESHDADANGHARLDEEIAPGDADNLFGRKRSALAAGLLLTAPGVPMLFQGQEFMETGDFNHWRPLDWAKVKKFDGIVTLYRHLIKLRHNAYNNSRGLLGAHIKVFMVDNDAKMVAFHRWDKGGPGDDVVVVANMANQVRSIAITFPRAGEWRVRFNSDWKGYGDDFSDTPSADVTTDGPSHTATISVGPYSLLVLSQDT